MDCIWDIFGREKLVLNDFQFGANDKLSILNGWENVNNLVFDFGK